MPRGVAKQALPNKTCVVCQRPFTWRKVWERCWDEVQTCSDRCKAERKKLRNADNRADKQQQQQQLIVMPAPDREATSWLDESSSGDKGRPPGRMGKSGGE